MDERKFEIIIHVTDEAATQRLIQSLETVVVPENFLREIRRSEGTSKYSAYETARQASDAKYKIYLDEHAVITDENFLVKLLEIFRDNSIGVVGTGGATELSTHGIILNSAKRVGKNFRGEVQVIDGFFFATQHDLPWRTDFTDNFFGGQAQCVEFKRAGYKIFVGGNWTAYRGEKISLDDGARQKFLDEYSADLFPLVSVIIPTYNRPKYFREALLSALNQTYRNIEIFVSDNSTDDATEQLIATIGDKRVKYFRHKNFDADDNWNFARSYNNPAAEYVNWLMDDDIFYPKKIEKMIEIYRNNPDITLVTSARNFIDENGRIIKNTQNIFGKDVKIAGNEAGKLLFTYLNYIGEPTTVLIRKKFLRDNDLCRNADERGFFTLVDMSTWLYLLRQGSMFRFIECLSALRTHQKQATYSSKVYKRAPYDYAKLLAQAWEEKFFINETFDFEHSVSNLLRESAKRINELFIGKVYDDTDAAVILLQKTTAALAQSLINGFRLELPPAEMWTPKNFEHVQI